jgi:hypothetical protein
MNSKASPLAGWILSQVEGKSYLGRPPMGWSRDTRGRLIVEHDKPVPLDPIFEFSIMMVPTPQGVLATPQLRPPFGMMSVRSAVLPRPGIWVAVDDLAKEEIAMFEQLVAGTEQQIEMQRRAVASGLDLSAAKSLPFGNGKRP